MVLVDKTLVLMKGFSILDYLEDFFNDTGRSRTIKI